MLRADQDAVPVLSPSMRMAGVRVSGGIFARFCGNGGTALADLTERGGYRLSLPSTFAPHIEAAQINTGGGVAGGDCVETALEIETGADVVYTTQGAERIYRSSGATAHLDVRIDLHPGARLDWLPQQMVLFAGAQLARAIEVDMSGDSRLLMVEILTFGRPASVERNDPASVVDQWRIRRDNRLVFAEALRFSGDMPALLDRSAVGGGARSSATLVYIATDAAERVDGARTALSQTGCIGGVSAWNGLLCARLLALRPAEVIGAAAALACHLAGRRMPRVWSI